MSDISDVSRLLFLLQTFNIEVPRKVLPHLVMPEVLEHAHLGPGATGIDSGQYEHLYRQGAKLGPGTRQEAIELLGRLVNKSMGSSTPWGEKSAVFSAIQTLSDPLITPMLEIDLSKKPTFTEVPKFDSGFAPLDIVTGGLYNGLLVIMGGPGSGKTSIMLTLMAEIILNRSASAVWFYENEIPGTVMHPRMTPFYHRKVPYRQGKDRLICGSISPDEILAQVKASPDPDRIIMFDSPDIVFGAGDKDRRFQLEDSYRTLIEIKRYSKLVVVPSQPRRSDHVLTMWSVAEAAAKAWFADIMVTLAPSQGDIHLSVVKNRFGPSDRSIAFEYNYIDMSWEMDASITDVEDW